MTKICGASLKTFGVIVGILYSIVSVTGFMFIIGKVLEMFRAHEINFTLTTLKSDANVKVLFWCTIVVYSVVCFVTSVLLVIGSVRNLPKFIAAWLVTAFVLLFLNISYVICCVFCILYNIIHQKFINDFITQLIAASWTLAVQVPIYNSIKDLHKECTSHKEEV